MVEGPPVCGVVITYHPDDTVTENLRVMVRECGRVVVVDNGSAAEVWAAMAAVPGVTLLPQGQNLGLAAALNLGVARAAELGCEWAVTFDQDSRPEPGMVPAMWAAHLTMPRAAVIGPRIHEEGSRPGNYRWVARHELWPLLFRRLACTGADLPEVTMMVTSGSMIELAAWRQLGGFDGGLFIDYIDTDYCLRVIRAGRRVAVAGQAVLLHRLGARQRHVLMGRVFRPTHHAAFRHYYIARNRMVVWRRHALAVPHWALFDLCFAVYNGFRVLAFEPNKWKKFRATWLGTWDGLCRRVGPCPKHRLETF
jgi:GT2 family glycosyltransferase